MGIKITQEIKDKCIWYGDRFRELSKGEHMKVLRASKLKDWQNYNLKKWIAADDHLKIIKEIGRLCVGKPSRYDSEQIEKIRKLCLKQIDTFNTDKLKEGENAKKS